MYLLPVRIKREWGYITYNPISECDLPSKCLYNGCCGVERLISSLEDINEVLGIVFLPLVFPKVHKKKILNCGEYYNIEEIDNFQIYFKKLFVKAKKKKISYLGYYMRYDLDPLGIYIGAYTDNLIIGRIIFPKPKILCPNISLETGVDIYSIILK